jgi:hypothetical protein
MAEYDTECGKLTIQPVAHVLIDEGKCWVYCLTVSL